jgi:hypothetical protein
MVTSQVYCLSCSFQFQYSMYKKWGYIFTVESLTEEDDLDVTL